MDEVAKTKLAALAIVQVKAKLIAMMDTTDAYAEGRRLMKMAAESLGLAAREGQKLFDDNLKCFKDDLEKFAERQAAGEVSSAVKEVEEEQEHHEKRLAALRQNHRELIEKLQDRSDILEEADDELAASLASFREELVRRVDRSHAEFMAIVQERHRLNLWHCFSKHLVPEGTVLLQLIDLYEIK